MKQKLSASLEDYLEAILELGEGRDGVKASDISQRLGVTRPSVTGALRLLCERKLINYAPYAPITLTPSGAAQARKVCERHRNLFDFLHNVLLIPVEDAEDAACSMEHILPEQTAQAFVDFTDFFSAAPKLRDKVAAGFREFLDNRGGAVK